MHRKIALRLTCKSAYLVSGIDLVDWITFLLLPAARPHLVVEGRLLNSCFRLKLESSYMLRLA